MAEHLKLPAEPIGWPLLSTPVNGELHYPTLQEGIKQSIRTILLTNNGELLLHAKFGAALTSYLHQPNQLITRRRIQDAITNAINNWEPRIILNNVDVWEIPDQGDAISIVISYVIKRTRLKESVKLTMSLGQ